MKRPALWVAYAITATTTAAYMGTFGYLGALLADVSRLPVAWLPAVLALFGMGAFIGLAIGGRTADRYPFATLVTGIVGLIFLSAAIAVFASSLSVVVALIFLLGVAGFLLNPAVWGRVYVIAPEAPTLVGATNSSAFQLGLTLAPLAAGLPLSAGQGLASIGWVGSAVAVLALCLAVLDARLSRA
jgi:DHA1 family chloramphenicol resistance protein-like MFS transporter